MLACCFGLGYSYALLDYHRPERLIGRSTYNFSRRLRLAVKNFFAYSSAPLKYCAYIGLFAVFLSLVYAFYTIINYMVYAAAPPGWTSIAILITGLGGFIIFQLGLIGIYIGQVMEEIRGRPLYVIADRIPAAPQSMT